MKRNPLTLIAAALVVAVCVLYAICFQVRKSEVAVVTTFGKPTRDLTEPGAYLAWPPPVQRVHLFDQRIQNFADQETQDITADGNNLLTMVYVGWRITDAKAFYQKIPGGSILEARKLLEGIVRQMKSAAVGKHPLSDFVNADEKELKFDQIESEIKTAVQSQLASKNYGIQVEFLGIQKLGLPESVTQTVFDRMKAERQVLVSRSENEGAAEAAKIKSAAEREAADVLAAAESQAIRIRGEGEVEAAKILPVFQQNPALASFLLHLDALDQALKERATLIFDQRTPPFDLFSGSWTNAVRK